MKVLINRTDAIGDTILTMPMAKMILEKFPDAEVTYLISAKCKDLFEKHDYIKDYVVYDRSRNFISKFFFLLNFITTNKFSHYFYVGGAQTPSFVSWFLRIPFRGGLNSRWQSFLFLNKGIRQRRSFVTMHDSEYNLNLLAPLGIDYIDTNRDQYLPSISLDKDEKINAINLFHQDLIKEGLNPDKELIFIHPGMTGHTLNWSSRNYGRLISRLEELFPNKYNYIISHTPSDERFLIGIKDYISIQGSIISDNIYFFNGMNRGLRDYMCVLSCASLFVGPSTGTTHIANTLGVKCVGLYSPIKAQSAARWSPFNTDKDLLSIIVPNVICGEQYKCSGKECPYYECMSKIEVTDVAKECAVLLNK